MTLAKWHSPKKVYRSYLFFAQKKLLTFYSVFGKIIILQLIFYQVFLTKCNVIIPIGNFFPQLVDHRRLKNYQKILTYETDLGITVK